MDTINKHISSFCFIIKHYVFYFTIQNIPRIENKHQPLPPSKYTPSMNQLK